VANAVSVGELVEAETPTRSEREPNDVVPERSVDARLYGREPEDQSHCSASNNFILDRISRIDIQRAPERGVKMPERVSAAMALLG
jgi:hypothetical protein